MEQKTGYYEIKKEDGAHDFTIFYTGDLIFHKETVKFQVEKDGKFIFTGTCLRACATAVATMGNHHQKVIKAIEDGKDFCNEVNVYWRMIDEEINQLSSFVKSIKNKKYVQNFHYQSNSKAEEHEE